MSYTKEKQRMILAQKVVEALKKLKNPNADKISQKEMQKQAQESIARGEKGKYHLVYKKDKRTIIAEPRGWEWEPKPKDICFDKAGHELMVVGINSRKPWIIEVAEIHEDGIEMDGEVICPDEVVPFVPWQKIEDILEKTGYWLEISKPLNEYLKKGEMKVGCTIYRFPRLLEEGVRNNKIAYAQATTRQMAVTLALLELEKDLK